MRLWHPRAALSKWRRHFARRGRRLAGCPLGAVQPPVRAAATPFAGTSRLPRLGWLSTGCAVALLGAVLGAAAPDEASLPLAGKVRGAGSSSGGRSGQQPDLGPRGLAARADEGALDAVSRISDSLAEEGRRLVVYTGMDWSPALDIAPAGGGPPSLYAGANYTRWTLSTDSPVGPDGRLILAKRNLHPSGAEGGHCLRYLPTDVLPPLNGESVIPNVGNAAVWTGGMIIMQGGIFKFCWSPQGTFGIADGKVVPEESSEYRVFGAYDTCIHGPGCLAARRFFCHVPHSLYTPYLPIGTRCYIFVQNSNTPLIYTRLTWVAGDLCGQAVGQGMEQWDKAWARDVDPLSRIYLGQTRHDLQVGFNYRLCFCPVHDASIDGVCGEPSDFVQQVGYIDGLVVSFLSVEGDARAQVIPMTRFTIHVDCGAGPRCEIDDYPRIKVIPKSWDPVYTATDLMHWDLAAGCPAAAETPAWYSPWNCRNATTGQRLPSHCTHAGGYDPEEKVFGLNETRFLPRLDSGVPVAQIFDVCFVHKPLEVDAIDPLNFNPASDDALQNVSRVFWKVGQLVVEPLWVRNVDSYVVNRDVRLAIAPPDVSRTSTVHGSGVPDRLPNGSVPVGPIVKLVQETPDDIIDNKRCGELKSLEFLIDGLLCTNASWCTPRGVKVGEELILNGNNPSHRIRVKKAGVYVVCYCEDWPGDPKPCEDTVQWLLVGKLLVQGPKGNEDWVLDTGQIQSIRMDGFGFKDTNTIIILQEGEVCNTASIHKVESSVEICPPGVQRQCLRLATFANATQITDIPGYTWKYNLTDPISYIEHVVPDGSTSLLRFSEVPVLEVGDTIHLDANIKPLATHWVRQRDLELIFRGSDHGFRVLELLDSGLTARIPLSLDPFPPVVITPPKQGKWWRSNAFRIPNIRGAQKLRRLPVCWGSAAGDYYAWAGYLNFEVPGSLSRLSLGITSTAAGARAPAQIIFRTGDNLKYLEPRNSMQLRVTFTNSSLMRPAEADINANPILSMKRADQVHEASQAVCGRLFLELGSKHPFGFPVPRGCYVDLNRYGSEGGIQSFYILFEAMNGLQANTEYTIVMNVQFPQPISDYSALDEPLLEIATLDDILVKPEGIVDVGWANPDKPIVEAARRSPDSADPRFFNDGKGGITILGAIHGDGIDSDPPPPGRSILELAHEDMGLSFLLRGDDKGKIVQESIIRLYFLPLTVWDFDYRSKTKCQSSCIPQDGHTCGPMDCGYEAAYSKCEDVVPPKLKYWVDRNGHECKWYADDDRCNVLGLYYTPKNGFTALDSCCACGGGARSNYNIVKLTLPAVMDPAFGRHVIHTIRLWRVLPTPKRGFFATRLGAQVSDPSDRRPDYATTAGRYILKVPDPDLVSPVLTLVDVVDWGNTRQFKADTALNDFYLRLTMPVTLFGTPMGEAGRSPSRLEITLPEGYRCRHALPASLRGTGVDLVALPILPEDSPTGNGALPASSSAAGGNASAPGANLNQPSGFWSFDANNCSFQLAPYLVLFEHQRLFLHIFAENPVMPLPKNDPRNYWTVTFTSSGHANVPANHTEPCDPYLSPLCTDTGESFFVNPVGVPLESRSFEPLYPKAAALSYTLGPIRGGAPELSAEEPNARNYTDTFAVLGILVETTLQPSHLHLAARNVLQLWFVPDLGCGRGLWLGLQTPAGFSFGEPCEVRDLPAFHYSTYAPPGGDASPRVWPLLGLGACRARRPPRWSPGGVTMEVWVNGALLSGRTYGLEVEVINPTLHPPEEDMGDLWWFRADISDELGYGRDGTYTTFTLLPNGTDPWRLYTTTVQAPLVVHVSEMRPYVWTSLRAVFEASPIVFSENITGQLRVIAPEGYEWAWDPSDVGATFIYDGLPNQTLPMPGGAPELPTSGRLNVIFWASPDLYLAEERYAFRTLIKVPPMPPRTSSNAFFFEWGFNASGPGRSAAVQVPAGQVRALRGAKLEASSTLEGDGATIWLRIKTITAISANGSLEVQLPPHYHGMVFDNYTGVDGMRYCRVLAVEDFESEALPDDLQCRRVSFQNGFSSGVPGLEVRLEISANISGIAPGRYVIELNVTNPPQAVSNYPLAASPCGYKACVSFYSMKERFLAFASQPDPEWASPSIPDPAQWHAQYDYWTSIAALGITTPMLMAEIVNLTLDERNACGRTDRPGQRSALVFVFALDRIAPGLEEELRIRAPVGWRFDYDCDFFTHSQDVFPYPAVMPQAYSPRSGANASLAVAPWPDEATVRSCRGDGHEATVRISPGLVTQAAYFFRIGIRQNPLLTPSRNTWALTYGSESSGHIRGFPVWTFQPIAHFEPILLAWTEKVAPKPVPLAFEFTTTKPLYGQAHQYIRTSYTVYMNPMMRLVMPPLYEVVVHGPDQDIQGGYCFAILELVGTCRLCNTPLDPATVTCVREMNRKNVAMITFSGDTVVLPEVRYKLFVTIYNPHIMNSEENPPRSWIVESFLGQPVPPARAPLGYQLDYRNVSGFKITGKAELVIEEAEERNASAFVSPKLFTMRFPDLLRPGDEIELLAPPGIETSRVVLALYTKIVCIDLQYLPVKWPTNLSTQLGQAYIQPPTRPPIPSGHPPWARAGELIVELPLPLNTSSEPSRNGSVQNSSEVMLSRGIPAWALAAADAAQNETTGNESHNASKEFLVLSNHCLGTWPNGSFNWTDLPNDFQLSLTMLTPHRAGSLRAAPNTSNLTHAQNGTSIQNGTPAVNQTSAWNTTANSSGLLNETGISEQAVLCLRATWHVNASVLEPSTRDARCREECEQRGAGAEDQACLTDCASGLLMQIEQLCTEQLPEPLPPGARPAAVRLLPATEHQPPTCHPRPMPAAGTRGTAASAATASNNSMAVGNATGGNTTGGCTCGAAGVLVVEVLWQTAVNLSAELEHWQRGKAHALALREFDRLPLQAPPSCVGNRVSFQIGANDLHPEPELLNGTTYRFRMAYFNPRAPPFQHRNFWILRHIRNGSVESSDVVASWRLISKIRYVTINLLTEVLRTTDPAEVHVEFVTVRPATRLRIIADFPEFFSFSQANITSIATKFPPPGGRRLLWQGFTHVTVESALDTQITIGMSVGTREYVRFRLGGVIVPAMGGQALFTMHTWFHGTPQDEIERCCPPGFPKVNPGVVFRTPHRLDNLRGVLQHGYHQAPHIYPIASTMGTRLNEQHSVSFIFQPKVLAKRPSERSPIIVVVRVPVAYTIVRPCSFYDSSATLGASNDRGTDAMNMLPSYIGKLEERRVEIVLPEQEVFWPHMDYKIMMFVQTPESHAVREVREDRRLWVIEITNSLLLGTGERPMLMDVYDDFELLAPVNFTVTAGRSPPELVIEVTITLIELGEVTPNRVDIYAPAGYKFLLSCLSPGQLEGHLKEIFISCREHLKLFQATYLSSAVLMTKNIGVPADSLPLSFKLRVKTPAVTPRVNFWYIKTFHRLGDIGWGLQKDTFPVIPMEAAVFFAAIAGSVVPLFLDFKIRYPVPKRWRIHLAGPRLYQLLCPVRKVLSPPGLAALACSQSSPILAGCWGLPSPDDPNPPFGLQLCDPLHELLLSYPQPTTGPTRTPELSLPLGTVVTLSLEARVPVETPRPRTENVFRIRLLDESLISIDSKLNHYTYDVQTSPIVSTFSLWWTRAAPLTTMTVAVGFSFGERLVRAEEQTDKVLRVIEVWAPEGIRMAIRRPADIKNLKLRSQVPVTEWNWTTTFPRTLWFGLDERQDVFGQFHYAFPVFIRDSLPLSNLWQVRFCVDSPFCNKMILSVPLPGFSFGEDPGELDAEAAANLIGSLAQGRLRPPAWLLWSLAAVGVSRLGPR